MKSEGGRVLAYCESVPVAVIKDCGKGCVLALGAGTAFCDFRLNDGPSDVRDMNKKALVRFAKSRSVPTAVRSD